MMNSQVRACQFGKEMTSQGGMLWRPTKSEGTEIVHSSLPIFELGGLKKS